MMEWIDGDSIDSAADHGPGLLQALFVSVVTLLAECLVILRIPEQFVITLVRCFMINHGCGDNLALSLMHHAEGMLA